MQSSRKETVLKSQKKSIQQQLSYLSRVFGVGYKNQKRITPDRAHGSAFSTHSYQAICSTHEHPSPIATFWVQVFVPPRHSIRIMAS